MSDDEGRYPPPSFGTAIPHLFEASPISGAVTAFMVLLPASFIPASFLWLSYLLLYALCYGVLPTLCAIYTSLTFYAVAEVIFFGYWLYLQYRQNRRSFPAPPIADVRALIAHIKGSVMDVRVYLSSWFYSRPFHRIGKANLARWLSQVFYGMEISDLPSSDRSELDELLHEHILDDRTLMEMQHFPDLSEESAPFMGLQEVQSLPRSLAAYFVTDVVAKLVVGIFMKFEKFESVTVDDIQFWVSISPTAPTPNSPTILFIHGIGGISYYLGYIRDLRRRHKSANIILLTSPHISLYFPTLRQAPTMQETVAATNLLFKRYDIQSAVFVGHSFGTAIMSWFLQLAPQLVNKALFLDPICFELAKPDVIYNFVYKIPEAPFNLLMWYYVCKEVGIAAFICRQFWWYQCILFPHQLPPKTHIFLSGKDQIVNSPSVRDFLSQFNLDIHYEPEHTHGGFLFDHSLWQHISNTIQMYDSD